MRRILAVSLVVFTGALAVPSVASAAYRFSGQTSQGKPVSAVLAKNFERERDLSRFKIDFLATCSLPGVSWPDGTVVTDIPLSRARRFRAVASYDQRVLDGASLNPPLATGHVTVSVDGRLSRRLRSMSGIFTATVAVRDPAGQQVDTCNTGPVSWNARLRR